MYLNALPSNFSVNFRGDINYWRNLLNELEVAVRETQSEDEARYIGVIGGLTYAVVTEQANPSDPGFQEEMNDAIRRYNAIKAATPVQAPVVEAPFLLATEPTVLAPVAPEQVYIPADVPPPAVQAAEAAAAAAQVIKETAIVELPVYETKTIDDAGFNLFPGKDEQPIMDFTFSNIPVTFSELYVSTFGRKPDVEGFNYWKGIIGGDLDLKEYDDFVYAGRLNGEKVNEQNVANIRGMLNQVAVVNQNLTPLIREIGAPSQTGTTQQAAGGNTGLLIAAALAALTLLG